MTKHFYCNLIENESNAREEYLIYPDGLITTWVELVAGRLNRVNYFRGGAQPAKFVKQFREGLVVGGDR